MVVLVEMNIFLPIIKSHHSIFVTIQYSEQFLSLLFCDINWHLFAASPHIVIVQDLTLLAWKGTKSIKTLCRIESTISDPLSDDSKCHIELFAFGSVVGEESWLCQSIEMTHFQWRVCSIKHSCSHWTVEVGHRSLHVWVVHLDVEVVREVATGSIVNIKKLLSFVGEAVTHISHVGKFLKIVWGQTHISSYFSVIDALGKYVSGISEHILIEFNSYEMISADELT